MVKVSAIIPVYNSELYLDDCLESLINQTLKDIEIIVVDDGSSDSSISILERYAKNDNRICILKQKNQGAGTARNYGMSIATGKYIIMLDSDDYFEPVMLEKMYLAAEKAQTEILVCRADRFEGEKSNKSSLQWSIRENLLPKKKIFSADDIHDDFFMVFMWWTWDKLYLRRFLEKTNVCFQNLRTSNDLFFTAATMLKANRISCINDVLVHQRIRKHSLSVTRDKSWDCFVKALAELEKFMRNENLFKIRERDFLNYCVTFGLWHLTTLTEKNQRKAVEYFRQYIYDKLSMGERKEKYYYRQQEYEKLKLIMDSKGKCLSDVKVSVVMPSLNVVRYIKKCLQSVVNQNLKEIEIICVDAGSTDGTLEIIEAYAAKDNRIKIIHSDRKSYGYQMNLGLQQARGEYLGIVETDDLIDINMYNELYAIVKKLNLDFIKTDFWGINETNGEIDKKYCPLMCGDKYYNRVVDIAKEKCGFEASLCIWSGIYKIEYLQENNIRFNETPGASYQDTGFVFQTFIYAKRAYFYNKAYYMYRLDNEGSSVNSSEKVFCICDEKKFMDAILIKHPEIYQIFKLEYTFFILNKYLWNLRRLDGEAKSEFYKVVLNEIKQFKEKQALSYAILNRYNRRNANDVMEIERDPEAFFNKIVRENEIVKKEEEFIFPFHLFSRGSRIVIYGAGNIGKQFYREASNMAYIKVVALIDKNAKQLKTDYYPVQEPCVLSTLQYDAILIAVHKKDEAKKIKDYLLNSGVDINLIYWDGKAYSKSDYYENVYFRMLCEMKRKI